MNIVIILERRQWLPMNQWNDSLLQRYCEDCAIQKMVSNKIQTTLEAPVPEFNDTMAVAFSSDGKYFASGQHLTHDIVIGVTIPYIRFWRSLSGHTRTPWVLTFDLVHPHILYSGCLAGKVCKWNVQDGGDCLSSFDLSLLSPVNSISPLPSYPTLLFVAVKHFLCLLSTADLTEVWRVETGSERHFVRLVVPHPLESKLLSAITNVNSNQQESFSTIYKIQLHVFHKDHPPNISQTPSQLAKGEEQLICSQARIWSRNHNVCVYSTLSSSYGECLYTLSLGRSNLVSMDLSPDSGYLLLGFVARRNAYHYVETRGSCDLEIYRLLGSRSISGPIHMERVGSIPSLGSNVAVWMPLNTGHGVGACFGCSRNGTVFFWRAAQFLNAPRTLHHCLGSS